MSELIDLAKDLAPGFAERASTADLEGALPQADISAMRSSGYLAASVPREYGGFGASLHDCVAAQLELAQGSTSTALVAAMQLHLFGHAAETRPYSEETFAFFCQQASQGKLFNSAASEPTLGSPSRGGLPATEAVIQDEALIITGHKNWVTGGEHLDYLLLRLRLGEEARTVWLTNHLPGIHWEHTWGKALSLRASDSHDVRFHNVHIPAANLLPISPSAPLIWFVMMLSASYFGTALAARNSIIRYALERVPTALGKPIASLPKIQRQIGAIDIQLQAAKTLLLETAAAWSGLEQQRQAHFAKVTAAKHFAIETALSVTDMALRIAGGASLGHDLPFERYFRDVRAGLMHPPSGDAALELVGKSVLVSL